ncbi:6-phosphogluconolactonase [Faunimonas pinastri]|uniref:6-phosphogluconolactonase n=1 Tax=Faunimonas pinastri TaxID=1855383 RepID=A0A1H9BZ26_9HYPH|nr:lactonase family protein [Faunimonas pinastri]SEP94275.1 6-phosphogluconolactonase [Faunimonas pinastri]
MSGETFAIVGCVNREAPHFQQARGTGIAVFRFDENTGRLELASETSGIDNPTFLSIHPENGCIYANSEVFGWHEGTVSAYRLDPAGGRLVYINKQPTLGSIAAFNEADRTGRFLALVNYAMFAPTQAPNQALVVFPIRPDGSLGASASSVGYSGSGPDAERQDRSHPHCVQASPDNRFLVVADLGSDRLLAFPFDAATGQVGAPPVESPLPPGSGPRHFRFHGNGRNAYVINELASTVSVLGFDRASGSFDLLQTVSTVPDGVAENYCAELLLSPDCRFLYGANRGHDSIASFRVDPETGLIEPTGHHPSGGRFPRNFTISRSGRFMLVANQNSDSIVTLAIDGETGTLGDTGEKASIGTPVCIRLT